MFYKDKDSFIVNIKIYDIYKDIAEDKLNFILQTNQINHCLKEKKEKSNWINERLIR